MPEVDIALLKKMTELKDGYSFSDNHVKWLFEVLEGLRTMAADVRHQTCRTLTCDADNARLLFL